MSVSFINSPDRLSPSRALHLSQQAPQLLQKPLSGQGALRIPFRASVETAETWTIYEHLFSSCLRTGDDKSAHLFLERLTDRFGASNERVMGLRGLYQEAVAEDDAALTQILADYENVLSGDPANTPIAKRRIALLRTMSKPQDAIAASVELLDMSPTDVEAWAELSDLYSSVGLYSQATYSLEEVLLVAPNAWNIQARMGEILYLSACAATSSSAASAEVLLVDAMRRFCRSIELCDNYLRGYYGLKVTTSRLLHSFPQASTTFSALGGINGGDLPLPSQAKVQRLNELATSKLSDIISHASAGDAYRQGYEQSEVIAARQLLDREIQPIKR